MRTITLALLTTLALAACGDDGGEGGGSGLDTDADVTELEAAELTELCEWGNAELEAAAGPVTCEGGEPVPEVPSVSECVSNLGGLACPEHRPTVADYEGCIRALVDDPCDSSDAVDQACEQLVLCGEDS
jgi:hypothetical protein